MCLTNPMMQYIKLETFEGHSIPIIIRGGGTLHIVLRFRLSIYLKDASVSIVHQLDRLLKSEIRESVTQDFSLDPVSVMVVQTRPSPGVGLEDTNPCYSVLL